MNKLEAELQDMFKNIYDAVNLKYLRPLQRESYKCCFECLDDRIPIDQTPSCVEECGRPIGTAMTLVRKEINSFQGRIDRCLMDCQDSVRNEKEERNARRLFDICAEKCVKKFVPVVPEVIKSLSEGLSKLKE